MKKAFILFIAILFIGSLQAQQPDSSSALKDSIFLIDSVHVAAVDTTAALIAQKLISANQFLNVTSTPVSLIISERKIKNMDFLFYSIIALLLLFALLKIFYPRYLNNMIRVFFNTSFRQSQLTDQLLQAKFPSLLFNMFFVIITGFYLYFLLGHMGLANPLTDYPVLLICISAVAIVYLVKYCVLKFTGWVSGYAHEADTYIFVVFLINKILAIGLIPIVIVMAFSDRQLVTVAITLSYVIIFLMLVLRFLRSWSILQNKVKLKGYHFMLYIIGIEIIPLLLIYKASMDLLKNNL